MKKIIIILIISLSVCHSTHSYAQKATNDVSFTATTKSNGVLLSWETLNDQHTNAFYVERKSASDTSFKTISTVLATSNSWASKYSYFDQMKPTISYTYRLCMVKEDNSVTYISTVSSTTVKKTDAIGLSKASQYIIRTCTITVNGDTLFGDDRFQLMKTLGGDDVVAKIPQKSLIVVSKTKGEYSYEIKSK